MPSRPTRGGSAGSPSRGASSGLMPRGPGTILGRMKQVAAAVIIDARGMVTGWSEGARRLTGHTAEDIVGRPAAGLLAEDLPPAAMTELTGVVALRHRDGHRV